MTGSPSVLHWRISFLRSQAASIAATVVDFGTLVFLVEVLQVWYVAATAMGALLGALTNFLLGRFWSFEASHLPQGPQVIRYGLVSFGSLLLNSAGVYLLTDGLGLKYPVSKGIVALAVGFFFNFPLHRYFVFRSSPFFVR